MADRLELAEFLNGIPLEDNEVEESAKESGVEVEEAQSMAMATTAAGVDQGNHNGGAEVTIPPLGFQGIAQLATRMTVNVVEAYLVRLKENLDQFKSLYDNRSLHLDLVDEILRYEIENFEELQSGRPSWISTELLPRQRNLSIIHLLDDKIHCNINSI